MDRRLAKCGPEQSLHNGAIRAQNPLSIQMQSTCNGDGDEFEKLGLDAGDGIYV